MGVLSHQADSRSTATEWLLRSQEPAIRYQARRDVLNESIEADPEEILSGPIVSALLSGQQSDGGFGCHPYKKWAGAHWRLVSLVELAVPDRHPPSVAAAETVLDWLTSSSHTRGIKVVNGLVRRCASQEGNALAVCCRLGMAEDPRVESLARSLEQWQWPDGGWNCDPNAGGHRSSFHESLAPAWGLHEYGRATGEAWAGDAAQRAAGLFLAHRLFRSLGTGDVIHSAWTTLHYPPYWHYDILQGLLVMGRLGRLRDERAVDALQLLLRLRRPDGLWEPGGYWWRRPGSAQYAEVVDWGRRGPNQMITLNALRALRGAGMLKLAFSA